MVYLLKLSYFLLFIPQFLPRIEGFDKMFTNEQKVKFVEDAIKEFTINPKFRDMLKWLIEEMDKSYDTLREKEWKEFWYNMDNPPKIKAKSIGNYRLVPCK